MPALATPDNLTGLYGAPFEQSAIDIASAGIRSAAGWHIAPEVTETLTVDSPGGTRLILPTLKLLEVTEIRDVREDDAVVLEDWRMSPAGVIYRACGWPCGLRSIEVDVVHGYEECPPELLPLIAAGCRDLGADGNIKSQTTGPFSVTYRDGAASVDPALARYTLPPRP